MVSDSDSDSNHEFISDLAHENMLQIVSIECFHLINRIPKTFVDLCHSVWVCIVCMGANVICSVV